MPSSIIWHKINLRHDSKTELIEKALLAVWKYPHT